LRCGRGEFIGYGVSATGVEFGGVSDFEDAVVLRGGVETGGMGYGSFVDGVEVALGVCGWVLGRGVGFFVEDCVVVAVDCRVDS
jgi:hypothetical protein